MFKKVKENMTMLWGKNGRCKKDPSELLQKNKIQNVKCKVHCMGFIEG